MLTDTPIQSSGPAIGAATGVLTGAVGFALAKAVIVFLSGASLIVDTGFFIQFAFALLLGLLFSTSHHVGTKSADIAIGVAFGIMTWVGSSIILPLTGSTVPLRDPAHFLGAVAFGLTFSVVSLLFKRPASSIQPLAD